MCPEIIVFMRKSCVMGFVGTSMGEPERHSHALPWVFGTGLAWGWVEVLVGWVGFGLGFFRDIG